MSGLFKRDWKLRVGGIDVTGLDFEAQVEKSLKPEPNKCSVSVYGLNQDTRRAIEALSIFDPKRARTRSRPTSVRAPKTGKIRVELEAGYEGRRSLIFLGDLRRAITERDEAEVVTNIEGEDGGRSVLSSRVSQSFPPGTPVGAVVAACAEAMGVGLGNILEVMPQLTRVYSEGTVLDGNAADELKGVLRRAELTYSIQNGNLQFLRAGTGLPVEAFLITPETGLIGSPQRDATGLVLITTLLLPNIAPGAYVSLKSRDYSGTLRISRIEYSLSSFGTDWYAKCECLPG